jgi:CheY-like chemotaxis protein
MDHMMPDMDGMETTDAIRKLDSDYAKTVPVIALTANAVSGMREMFLENGFNDYLAKPIEIAKLDEVMENWTPKEKQIAVQKRIKREVFSGKTSLTIEGVDVNQGISMTGGTEEGYCNVLEQFCKDAVVRLPEFKSVSDEIDLKIFATQSHALKSALAAIGAPDVSKEAAALEMAGKENNAVQIKELLPVFYEHLSQIIENVSEALALHEKTHSDKKIKSVKTALKPKFTQLKTALEEKNMKEIDRLIRELEKTSLDKKAKEIVNGISDNVLMSEYKEAIQAVNELLKK